MPITAFLSHIILLLIYPLFYLELFCNAQQYNQTGLLGHDSSILIGCA